MTGQRWLALAGLLVFLLIAGGCETHSELQAAADNYSTRLARSLDQPAPDIAWPGAFPMPPPRDLQVPVPETSIDLLDFLRLYDCPLHSVIAEKNSSLGRLAVESQDLFLQVAFLREVDGCIESLPAEHTELRETLDRARDAKTEALPAYIWRATLGADEFRQFWRRDASSGYPADADPRMELAVGDLLALSRELLAGDYELDESRFTDALAVVRLGEGGELLDAWRIVAASLAVANTTVEGRIADRPLCYEGMVTPKSQVFRNVVLNYFVGDVQVRAASLDQRFFALMPVVRELEKLLSPGEPATYRQWRGARNKLFTSARSSLPAHVESLAPLMQQCGFLPAG